MNPGVVPTVAPPESKTAMVTMVAVIDKDRCILLCARPVVKTAKCLSSLETVDRYIAPTAIHLLGDRYLSNYVVLAKNCCIDL